MPKTVSRRKTCALCGKSSSQPTVKDAKRHGAPDLDTRPPADIRFSIDTLVQRCPGCGYCFPDITQKATGADETIKNEAYKKQLDSADFPKLANRFLCWSLVEEQAGDLAAAGWACIHAAWVCDDATDFNTLYSNVSHSKVGDRDEATGARLCRTKAIQLLKRARDEGKPFGAQPGAEEALMADLLRRTGRFQSAIKMAGCGLELKPATVVETVLEFERNLAEKGDTDVHTITEAIKWKGELSGPPQPGEKQGD